MDNAMVLYKPMGSYLSESKYWHGVWQNYLNQNPKSTYNTPENIAYAEQLMWLFIFGATEIGEI